MADDIIGYEALAQDALRGVVRRALDITAKAGAAPGEHHFYITFKTKARGVVIADYLADKYPDEMTIVVQHQFWDLMTDDKHFEVVLKFAGVPQHLSIPWGALTRFFDPSVRFGLQFDAVDAEAANEKVPEIAGGDDANADAAPATAGVVSLDAFRRKK